MPAFPAEIWKECFKDSPPLNLKILSTLSKQFNSIFQPLFFRELEFCPDRVLRVYCRRNSAETWEESVASYFKPTFLFCRWEEKSWKKYLAHLVRANIRFSFIAADPCLSSYVRKCKIQGPGSMHPTPADPRSSESLAGLIKSLQDGANLCILNCCKRFSNLRVLCISSMDITVDIIKKIEQIPQLEDLTLDRCFFTEDPDTFHLPALIKLSFELSDMDIARGHDPKPNWASRAISIIPVATLQNLSFDLTDFDDFLELRPFEPLRTRGTFTLLHSLFLPLPRLVEEVTALIGILENTPALRTLQLQSPDWPSLELLSTERTSRNVTIPYYEVPPIRNSTAPLLEELVAPIRWARCLVPGRPIRSLNAYRVLTHLPGEHEYTAGYEYFEPWELLKTLSQTSARIEKLRLPVLEEDWWNPVLGFVAELFPHVKDLGLFVPDEGVDNIPRPTPSPPGSPAPQPPPQPPAGEATNTNGGISPGTLAVVEDSEERSRRHIEMCISRPFVEPSAGEVEAALSEIFGELGVDLLQAPSEPYPVAESPDGEQYGWVYKNSNEYPPSNVTEDVAYSTETFPGAIYHAATVPNNYPLPALLERVTFIQTPLPEGRCGTPFYLCQERKVLKLLAARYPRLKEVIWIFKASLNVSHRWRLVEGVWVIKPTFYHGLWTGVAQMVFSPVM